MRFLHNFLRVGLLLLTNLLIVQSCKVKDYTSDSRPIDHKLWDTLLERHVTPEGIVDYQGIIADSSQLNAYLDLLSENHPNEQNWSRDQRLAYWINAYNAFTVKLIVDHYPLQSIKDIKNGIPFVNTVWDIKFIKIESREYDLNNIEHGIIRPKFDEPRIHFAVNCASKSCPKLLNEAFVAERLDEQLDRVAHEFIAQDTKNTISRDALGLSSIFSWYGSDFRSAGGVEAFVRKYSQEEIGPDPRIDYLDYDWSLNGKAYYSEAQRKALVN